MEPNKKINGNSSQDGNAQEKLHVARSNSRRKIVVPKPSEWKKRRLRLDIGLFSILFLVVYIIFSKNDSVIYQQSVIALIGAGVALLGQYVFGAVWDDKNYLNTISTINQNAPTETENPNSINNTDNKTEE